MSGRWRGWLGVTDPKFKPSAVSLAGVAPLIDTFQSAKAECWAAMMIMTLAANGDAWRPVKPTELGFAEWSGPGDADGLDRPMALTDLGLAQLVRWVRS